MKKRVIFLTALLMLTTKVWASDIRVELDGEEVEFSQQKPVIVDGRTLIPIRGVFEKLGYEISWDADTKTASFENGESAILITAESSIFLMNGEEVSLDVPASILNGSMLLPLRAVVETAGFKVNWNGETKTVYLETSDEESSYKEDMAELTENAETVYQESVIYSLLSLYLPDEHNRRERIAEMFLITDDRSDLNNVTSEGSEITEIFKKASEELLPDLFSEDLYNIILAFF
ncbi:MAG: copper amine oxidase N-terminal domain-containing protein [Clostridiales bacterium]|nr:copper amine oxidase N-terminal domain-containing protein [Clostridiales bacterium]